MKRNDLASLPLETLERMLADTERFAGPAAVSVIILRRAVEKKRRRLRRVPASPVNGKAVNQ